MNIRTIALAALLTVSAPALAFAQDAAPADPAAAAVSGQIGAADFDAFLTALGSADFTSATSALGTATTFNVVKLSTLPNADAAKLPGVIDPLAQDIEGLRAQVAANAGAKAALDAQGVTADQVVWSETAADGSVILYINDLG
jgi:hypothetical protein